MDAIPPESNAAREFRDAVDDYLTKPKAQRNSQAFRDRLSKWAEAAVDVRPMFEQNSLLTENVPVSAAVEALCRMGLESVTYLDEGTKPPPGWKDRSAQLLGQYNYKRIGRHPDSDCARSSKAGGSSAMKIILFLLVGTSVLAQTGAQNDNPAACGAPPRH